jgi:hypothetical protein
MAILQQSAERTVRLLLVMDHFEYATVRLRQLDFRSASGAHGCQAALAVRAAQSAINSPHAILQHRFKGPFGFDLFFPIDRNQHGLSYLHCRFRIGDEAIFRRVGLCLREDGTAQYMAG